MKNCNNNSAGCCGGFSVYSLGVIGALVYYLGQAPTFWVGFAGIFKALVWPAYIVFEVLKKIYG